MQRVVARQSHQLRCQQELIESYERLSRKLLRRMGDVGNRLNTIEERLTQADTTTPTIPVPTSIALTQAEIAGLNQVIAYTRAELILNDIPLRTGQREALLSEMSMLGSSLRPDSDPVVTEWQHYPSPRWKSGAGTIVICWQQSEASGGWELRQFDSFEGPLSYNTEYGKGGGLYRSIEVPEKRWPDNPTRRVLMVMAVVKSNSTPGGEAAWGTDDRGVYIEFDCMSIPLEFRMPKTTDTPSDVAKSMEECTAQLAAGEDVECPMFMRKLVIGVYRGGA
jgi:hypothetical protein